MSGEGEWPELGEFLVCTITTVKQNGVYVDLDGYPGREGFVFIGEVASGWVKNIRSVVREGQRVVAKALKVRRDKKSVELSIKSVSDERRRNFPHFHLIKSHFSRVRVKLSLILAQCFGL